MYAGTTGTFARLNLTTNTWEARTSSPVSLAYWGSPALALGDLWEIRNTSVVRFRTATNTWTTVRSDLMGGDQQSMTVTDRDGNLWAVNGTQLVRYNPTTDTVSYFPTTVVTNLFETRVGYDEITHSIYFGGFSAPNLYRWDIATSTLTALASHPEGMLNDIFCADHSGHIYAAGGSSGNTIWQYDIATNMWNRIVDLPADHGNNGSCSVHEDGWLYVEPGSLTQLHRIQLF